MRGRVGFRWEFAGVRCTGSPRSCSAHHLPRLLVFIGLGAEGRGFKAVEPLLGCAYSDLGGWVSSLVLPGSRNVIFSGAADGMCHLSEDLLPKSCCWED